MLAFTGLKDPETGAEIAANIAGGMAFGIGDVGALLKNLYRMAPWSDKDPNKLEILLSALGLVTEFFVGVGEIIDAPISLAKAIVARLGDSPLAGVIVKRVSDFILSRKAVPDGETELLDALLRSGDSASDLKNVIRSEDGYDALLRTARKFSRLPCTLSRTDPLPGERNLSLEGADPSLGSVKHIDIKACNNAFLPAIARLARRNPQAADVVVRSLGRLSDDVFVAVVKNPDHVVGRLGNIVEKSGVRDPELYGKILNNKSLYSKLDRGLGPGAAPRTGWNPDVPGYNMDDLLDDMDWIADVKGFDLFLSGLKSRRVPKARGTVYEVQVTAQLRRDGVDIAEVSRRGHERTDLDIVLADGTFVQIKNGTGAIGGEEKTIKFISRALKSGAHKEIRYIFPPGTRVPEKVEKIFKLFEVVTDIKIPFKSGGQRRYGAPTAGTGGGRDVSSTTVTR